MNFRLMTAVSTLALFGAMGGAQAATVAPTFGECPGISDNFGRSSAVLSSVQAGAPNSYNFKVCNTSNGAEGEVTFALRDWELPYDPQGQIDNIITPAGWGWAIETIGIANPATGWDAATPTWFDPDDDFFDARYLGLTQVLHFYTCSQNSCYGAEGDVFGEVLFQGESLEGFGFTSPFGETNAPYQASWVEFRPRSGDPAFPLVGANTPGLRNPVPEPAGLALFALGLGAAMAARARRQGRKAD
jgi:PEP-CTERM motif